MANAATTAAKIDILSFRGSGANRRGRRNRIIRRGLGNVAGSRSPGERSGGGVAAAPIRTRVKAGTHV